MRAAWNRDGRVQPIILMYAASANYSAAPAGRQRRAGPRVQPYNSVLVLVAVLCIDRWETTCFHVGWGTSEMSFEEALETASRDDSFKATVYAMNTLLIQKGIYTQGEFEGLFVEWVEKEQRRRELSFNDADTAKLRPA
jgi:hypothetical protein